MKQTLIAGTRYKLTAKQSYECLHIGSVKKGEVRYGKFIRLSERDSRVGLFEIDTYSDGKSCCYEDWIPFKFETVQEAEQKVS